MLNNPTPVLQWTHELSLLFIRSGRTSHERLTDVVRKSYGPHETLCVHWDISLKQMCFRKNIGLKSF